MKKHEFIKLVMENISKCADNTHQEKHEKLVSYCYDILCSDKELARLAEGLASTKQELEEKIREAEHFKSKYLEYLHKNEVLETKFKVSRQICKYQAELLEIKE